MVYQNQLSIYWLDKIRFGENSNHALMRVLNRESLKLRRNGQIPDACQRLVFIEVQKVLIPEVLYRDSCSAKHGGGCRIVF